jgi:hypothetical protein
MFPVRSVVAWQSIMLVLCTRSGMTLSENARKSLSGFQRHQAQVGDLLLTSAYHIPLQGDEARKLRQ